MQISVEKNVSKNNKTYYGIYLVKNDYKILLKFITQRQYEELIK